MKHLKKFNESKGHIKFGSSISTKDGNWKFKYNTKKPNLILNQIDDFSFFSEEYDFWKNLKSGRKDMNINDGYKKWGKSYLDKLFKIFEYLSDNDKKLDVKILVKMFKELGIPYKINYKNDKN